jgi:hypothetical protein
MPPATGAHRGSNSAASQQEEGEIPMSNTPTLTAFVVTDVPEGSDKKAQWFEIAKVWEHKDKSGFDVVLPPGVTVSGRLILRRNKARAD